MAEPYNLTQMSGQNTLYGFMTGANAISDGYIGIMTVIVTFIIAFVWFKTFESKKAFAGASFITALIAMILRVLTWINDPVMFTTFILAAISLVLLRWGGD